MSLFPTRIKGPLAVIGDVHGQADKLWAIVDQLRQRPDFMDRWILFLGDLCDRGPDSQGAIQIVRDLMATHGRVTALAGNHDLAMAASLGLVETPEYCNWSRRWIDHYDSQTTFASYGASFGDLPSLRQSLPDSHAELLANLPWVIEHPEYVFVHAGLDPHVPYQTQIRILVEKDFTLSRPAWLCEKSFAEHGLPADCPKTVVSGHVYVPDVSFSRQRILCDTTGGLEGDLSCVLLPEKTVISSGSSRTSSVAGEKRRWKVW